MIKEKAAAAVLLQFYNDPRLQEVFDTFDR